MRVLLVIAVLIAYGSLYPGDFSPSRGGDAVGKFLTDWRWFTSLTDLLGNVALFFPLGVAAMFLLSRKSNIATRSIGALFLAFVFSFALQLAQVWLPSRSAALADVMWNMAGMMLGMSSAYMTEKHALGNARLRRPAAAIPLLILMLWVTAELLPLVPSLDLQKFRDALKPLFLEFRFSFPQAIMHAAGAMTAGSALVMFARKPLLPLAGLLILVLAGKLAIVNLVLDASLIGGLAAGYTGYLIALRLDSSRIFRPAFWALFGAWTLVSVTPFSPSPSGSFNLLPFATMLHGSLEVAARGLVLSLFIYTALLWLAQRTGTGIRKATAGLLAWSCLIELAQMMLGRTADVTEPLLLLLVSSLLPASSRQPEQVPRASEVPTQRGGPEAVQAGITGERTLILLAGGIVICASAGWFITRSPWVPYNIRELVYEGHPFRSLISLAALLYWSMGFPVLMAQWLTRGKLYLVNLPPLVLLHGLVAWMLLRSAVPDESIHDIVGSPVLGWPWDWELLGRFLALFSFWSVAVAGGTLAAARHTLSRSKSALFAWGIGACLLVPFSYHVVVTAASTDNLVELMARNGSVSAFLLIGLAIALISFGGTKSALAAIPGAPRGKRTVVWAAGSGILAYAALYLGLEQIIVKYNQVFSALQFLLSSDRSHLAKPAELMIRYMALYGFFLLVIVTVQNPLWRWTMSTDRAKDSQSQVSRDL
jgi:hypothetical protein